MNQDVNLDVKYKSEIHLQIFESKRSGRKCNERNVCIALKNMNLFYKY